MKSDRKVKVSVTLSTDLLARIDREAARQQTGTRSGVIESWLRKAARDAAEQQLARETIAYYDSLTPAQRAEDEEWVELGAGAASELDIDGEGPTRPQRRRRRK